MQPRLDRLLREPAPKGRRSGRPPAERQTTTQSAYNTYKNTPACHPGRSGRPGTAALTAALHPADGPWYWLRDGQPDETGKTKFTATYAEYLKNEQKSTQVLPDLERLLSRAALRGPGLDPVEHSLSPTMHRAAYAARGLDWTYDAVEVSRRARGLPGRPRRELARPVADHAAEADGVPLLDLARRPGLAGAANTLLLTATASRAQHRHPGRRAAMARRRAAGRRAVVLGGGATATSVLLALADLGCGGADLVVRDPARATRRSRRSAATGRRPIEVLRPTSTTSADLVVSTIPPAAQTRAWWRRSPPFRPSSRSSTTPGRHPWPRGRRGPAHPHRRDRPAALPGRAPGASMTGRWSTCRSRRSGPRARRDSPNGARPRAAP